jgi:hypothetical protein
MPVPLDFWEQVVLVDANTNSNDERDHNDVKRGTVSHFVWDAALSSVSGTQKAPWRGWLAQRKPELTFSPTVQTNADAFYCAARQIETDESTALAWTIQSCISPSLVQVSPTERSNLALPGYEKELEATIQAVADFQTLR